MAAGILDRNNSSGRSFYTTSNRSRITPSSSSPSPYSNYYEMMTRSSSTSSSRPPTIFEHDDYFHVIPTPSRSSSSSDHHHHYLAIRGSSSDNHHHHRHTYHLKVSSFVRTILKILSFPYTALSPPACHWLSTSVLGAAISPRRPRQLLPAGSTVDVTTVVTSSHRRGRLGRKVTGTLFGYRRGHVTFAVQDGPGAEPALLLELAMTTASLVKEMSSGLVRIALECDKSKSTVNKLYDEAVWSMYCNGRKSGYATARRFCEGMDSHVLNTVRSVSVGAGVIPATSCALGDGKGGMMETASFGGEGEMLYMRAKFERVVGNRDSEAFYMMNPDGSGGPELSLFLLRL